MFAEMDDNMMSWLGTKPINDIEEAAQAVEYILDRKALTEASASNEDNVNIYITEVQVIEPEDVADKENENTNIKNQNPDTEIQNGTNRTCRVCLKVFSSTSNLRRHLRKHTGLQTECSLCPKVFYSNYELKRHMMAHSGEEHNCDVC